MLRQDFFPFNLVRYYVCPVMNLVSDGFWLVTYLALCDRPSHCHGAAPRKGGRYYCKLAAYNLLFLLLNPPFGSRQTHFVLNQTPEQELVRGL